MNRHSVIKHALGQGVTLRKVSDLATTTAPQGRTPLERALPVFTLRQLGRNDLRSLGRAFNTLAHVATMARVRDARAEGRKRDLHSRSTVWILVAGNAWQESSHEEVAGFRAQGFQPVVKLTPAPQVVATT